LSINLHVLENNTISTNSLVNGKPQLLLWFQR